MIRLDNAGTRALSLITGQNGANVTVGFSDYTISTGAYVDTAPTCTTISSATTTSICATPASGVIRDLDYVTIYNTFAGAHAMTLQITSGSGGPFVQKDFTLQDNESITFTHGGGYVVTDANGNIKTTVTVTQRSRQVFLSGSSATYTTPANAKQIFVRMKGGGGGGAGNDGGDGAVGGDSYFASASNNARGGTLGVHGVGGADSGTAGTAQAPIISSNLIQFGAFGGSQRDGTNGGKGAPPSPPFQKVGAPGGASDVSLPTAGQANTGAGGGGGGSTGGDDGGGGGAGEYAEYYSEVSPGTTYNVVVGVGGAGGTVGSGGSRSAGANGGSGLVIVEEMG